MFWALKDRVLELSPLYDQVIQAAGVATPLVILVLCVLSWIALKKFVSVVQQNEADLIRLAVCILATYIIVSFCNASQSKCTSFALFFLPEEGAAPPSNPPL
jgi:hypothetical protein